MTTEVPLTQGRSCIVDDVDAEWIFGRRWCVTAGYPARAIGKPHPRVFYMHREIAVRAGILADYEDPVLQVDHINQNKFDNRRSNLRAATHGENMTNVKPRTSSGLLGIYKHPTGGWGAEFTRYKKKHRKYGFRSPEEAWAWRTAEIERLGYRF